MLLSLMMLASATLVGMKGSGMNVEGKSKLVRDLEAIVLDPGFVSIPGRVYDPGTFGATGDGRTICTEAIQEAIDAAHAAGGGVVCFKPGVYRSGALFVKSNVELRLDEGVVLQAVQDDALYPRLPTRIAGVEMDWPAAFINVYEQENVRIAGKGVIDGNGEYWWKKFNDMRKGYQDRGLRWAVDYDCERVRAVVVWKSANVQLKDFTIQRSGFWTVTATYCERIHVDGVVVRNNLGGHGPSSDGINTDSSSWVLVENCDIDCNDDNLCLKSGKDADGLRVNRPVENVVYRNCITRAGHGMFTIGSETSGGMRNIEVYGLKAHGTTAGIRFKSAKVRGGVMENMYFHDIEMINVKVPFPLDMDWYPEYSNARIPAEIPDSDITDRWRLLTQPVVPPERGIPEFRDIRFCNISVLASGKAISAKACEGKPFRCFTWRNITFEVDTAGEIVHAADWKMENVTLKTADGKGFTLQNCLNVEVPSASALPQGEGWPFAVTPAQRPGVYWWWPGSAVTKGNIDWNLEGYRDAGFGLVHIIPIYGARSAEPRQIPYLSLEWMEMLDHTVRKAASLGITVDMTTGTGWNFGGPDLPPDAVDAKAHYDEQTKRVELAPGMMVKRAAPGGEGHMINPFSPRAMDLYLERFSKAFDESGTARPRAQYHDSFEYNGNWSAELLDAFKASRGYDLRDHLDVFFGKSASDPDTLARLKCDYRQTLAELHRDAIRHWSDWAHQRGMMTRNQAHGAAANLLDVYAASDIPEPEIFGGPDYPIPGYRRDPAMNRAFAGDPRVCMLAASAAHVAHPVGQQLVTSETGTWMIEHWHERLPHIKLEVDLFFLAGANQMLFHGSCYSPREAPWPGWFFYASTQMNSRNSIWRNVPTLTDFIGRCQAVLQAGRPANDVLLYWPIHDLWMTPEGMDMPLTVVKREWIDGQRFGQVASQFLAKGYAFDFISDRMLESLTVSDKGLVVPGGTYRTLVVPACKYMPETTLRRLAELREQGATIVFEQALPSDVPGWGNLEARRAQLASDRMRLMRADVILATDAVAGLEQAGVTREPMADLGVRFIRRKIDDAYWYFIANHTAKDVDGWVSLGVPFAEGTLYDPMTGKTGRLSARTEGAAGQVYLQLAAGESVVLCAGMKSSSQAAWPYVKTAGEPVPLTGEWSVEFVDGGPELPSAYKIKDLVSWTETADARAKAFAGTARYTMRFPAPDGKADDWMLDLGDVRDSARVRLNGEAVGALISLPFRARVGSFLKPGANTLEIEVTNLSANRIRDLELRKVDWKIMKDANIVTVNYKKFCPDTWALEDSGLLGPVVLRPLASVEPKCNKPGSSRKEHMSERIQP